MTSDLWHFEDFRAPSVLPLGQVTVTEEEILDFARRYDPQPFHVDPVAAQDSPFGGLIASGWNTVALLTRLWVDGVLNRTAGAGSPGVDSVRFLVPVRPGDTLTGSAHVTEMHPSRTKDWRGTVFARVEGQNQRGERVCHFATRSYVRRRTPVHAFGGGTLGAPLAN